MAIFDTCSMPHALVQVKICAKALCPCTMSSNYAELLLRENEGSKGDENERELVVNPNQPNKERSGSRRHRERDSARQYVV